MNMTLTFNEIEVLKLCGIIASFGIFISGLEKLTQINSHNIFLSSNLFKLRYKWIFKSRFSRISELFLSKNLYKIALISGYLSSAFIPFTIINGSIISCLYIIILIWILFSILRNIYGLDGSDHMNLIVFSTLVISSLVPADSIIQQLCLWFISLQYCLL